MVGTFLLVMSLVVGTGATRTSILKPITSTGEEVGLIFIPGAFLTADQYNDTARAIQEASQLRLWVALTDGHFAGLASGLSVPEAVEDAMKELEDAGMTSKNYVGVGHGWGGRFLKSYAEDSDLKAVVLLGATISRHQKLKNYTKPVLTLAGELDGITTITRVVEEYDKLTDNVASFFKGLYRTPVILIEGSNHAQFASGDLRSDLQSFDLKPNVTIEEAHEKIGQHVSDFLTVTFGTDDAQVDEALEELTDAFVSSALKFQPFVDVRDMDSDGMESMWTVVAQEVFAGEFGDRVGIFNEIEDDSWFYGETPTVSKSGDVLIIGTYTDVNYLTEEVPSKMVSAEISPKEVSMKLISKNQIWRLLGNKNDTTLRSAPNTCKTLNKLALYLALGVSTQDARERYFNYGRKMIFEDDVYRRASFLWASSSFHTWGDRDGLHVVGVAMETPKLHYCKVLPVYRAMEWVNVLSLRDYPVQG